MASVTYWSQLQPSPYTPSIANGLAAAVRDPAWMLARQWQVAEFEGLDGGSPAYVRIGSHIAQFDSATLGETTVPLAPGQLLEPFLEAETPQPDLATRVELGQTFEALVPAAIAALYRSAYPIDPAGPDADPDETRFRTIFAGRVTDGVALYQAAKAAKAAHHGLPHTPTLNAAQKQTALHAVNAFIDWVKATWGSFDAAEPPAWDATRLDYRATVAAGELTLSAEPDAEAALDWYAFDLTAGTPLTDAAPTMTSVIPGHVRFRGMPNPRWWNFESSTTDFGGLLTDSRDLAKLLFADFLLIHGDDWYLARLDVPTGSLCWIDSLTVTDVFATTTEIPAADAPAGNSWTIFTTTDQTSDSQPCLITPASAAAALQAGPPLEELHLLRDETADMAWAIERIAETTVGTPTTLNPLPEPTTPSGAPTRLTYELQTPLPANWFPLLPVPGNEELALIAGTIEGSTQTPATLLLQQLSRDNTQIPQHEISRAGLKLQRLAYRTRTPDGGSTLWVARRRHIGAGEASSGLRYDQAQTVPNNQS